MPIPHSRTVARRAGGDWRAVIDEGGYAYPTFTTAAPPDRVFVGLDPALRPDSIRHLDAQIDFKEIGTPLQALSRSKGKVSDSLTRASLLRLEAAWLLGEDRYGLLDVGAFEPLPHQLSLVEHVTLRRELSRVLIADEVGLGKTIETALIIRRLSEGVRTAPLRVLYLTEARLVDNVAEEFRRVGVAVRRWAADAREATLGPGAEEGAVVASMHRAVASREHTETLEASGPWDVLIVDEAHHLTDWSDDGGDPQRRMRLVRNLLKKRMSPDGRLILLSGTPHQGHAGRFKNVLKLLDERLEDEREAAGRVIYRIKEDIKDWDGDPLFPVRKVYPPTVVEVPPRYQEWLDAVSRLLSPGTGSRAGAWRRAQALEWCASSPEAGLAYLVRLALRCGFRVGNYAPLKRAILAIRPYRGGPFDEQAEALQGRLLDAVDEYGEPVGLDRGIFEEVIDAGVTLVEGDTVGLKIEKVRRWIDEAKEKFVVFAQPVDTVHLLARRMERELGKGSVSLILGGQSSDARRREIERFRNDRRVKVLVSSRSGGEGINLQVSRHLVHFDIPWNPMDLEQRVGRVHRYGGFKTVHVHTLVLSGSREERVLARCRAKLAQAIRDIDLDRFELLFARTMSMVPLDELAAMMAGENLGPLRPEEGERLDRLVQAGFQEWRESDGEFRRLAAQLPELKRGQVRDDDLAAFLGRASGFERISGWSVAGDVVGRESQCSPEPVPVFRLPDGAIATTSRVPVTFMSGSGVAPGRAVGLNDPAVAAALRAALQVESFGGSTTVLDPRGCGAVDVGGDVIRGWVEAGAWEAGWRRGAVFCAYLVRSITRDSLRDAGHEFACYFTGLDGTSEVRLEPAIAAAVIRGLRSANPASEGMLLGSDMHSKLERRRIEFLARQGDATILRAIFPMVALIVRDAEVGAR